jgi:glutathione S-transferase
MSLKLYIANKNYSSWSLRPWVLMRELVIPFEEQLVPFNGTVAFDTFSPTGRVPCLVDGAVTVWDSLAITEYLADTYSKVWPNDRTARAWARSASAEMHSGFQRVRSVCSMNCGIRVKLHPQSSDFYAEWQRIDELWNEGLQRFGGPYLAGSQFCAVDAFFAPVAFRVQSYSPRLSAAASAYVTRLLQLPSMVSWYTAALQERWRDEPHDAEARSVGEWLEDLRAKA